MNAKETLYSLKIKLPESKFGTIFNKFLNSPYYLLTIGIITVLSNIFALEIAAYTIIAIMMIIALIFCEDTKALIANYLFLMMPMSYKNGPIYHPSGTQTIFDNSAVMIYFYTLLGVITLAALYHIFIYQDYLKLKKLKRGKLLGISLIALFVAQLLGGLGSSYYTPNNLMFNFTYIGSMAISLLFLTITAFSDGTDPIKYFVKIAITYECIMIAEMINIFVSQNVITNGSINKGSIVTGWGLQNNFGGYMCMMMPFITYAAKKYKYGFAYTIFLFIVAIFIVLTCSRTSIMFAGIATLISVIYLIIPTKKKYNIPNLITIGAVALISIIGCFVFMDKIESILKGMIETGFSDNGRYHIWEHGIELFKEYPVLGTGWFSLDPFLSSSTSTTMTPRWFFHNTIVQYLASTGIVGLLCFLFFIGALCYQGFRYPTERRLILMFSIFLLIGMSMLDIFQFNYIFIRVYAMVLGLVIIEPNKKEIQSLNLNPAL